jgi:hypothetical protein
MTASTLKVGSATPDQIKQRMSAVRANIAGLKMDDLELHRFLIARQYDVEKTTQMINGYYDWRKVNNIDSLKMPDGKDVSIYHCAHLMNR